METTVIISIIMYVVFGVLGIILFFKIWGMTNDVKELKEFLLSYSNKTNTQSTLEDVSLEDTLKSLENQQKKMNVTWNHKFNIGDVVIYKHSGKRLCVALILDKEKEYQCMDLETKQLLSAVFDESELIKEH